MPKILLVEDDKSLREIYSIRLVAEGYDVTSAGDGEEALALAVQQKPDLILSDVMMPKISGFDMLDILRSTPETKDVKVIMMTALSSEDQRQRGENLGADRYLVKSQVGIEDVINAVKEVLTGAPASNTSATTEGNNAASAPQAAPTGPLMGAVDMSTIGVTPATTTETAVPEATPVMAPAAAPAEVTAVAETAPTAAEAAPAATPAAMPVDTGAAMDALVNETPDQPNAVWPGNTAQ